MRNHLIYSALGCVGLSFSSLALAATVPTTMPSKVTPADQLQFQQKNVSAQMQELQERMYRLAELTREAEPGDSARLLLAVKRAREQLIIEEMKEVLESLGQRDLGKATVEEKQVLAKLEELKRLLLSTDLDLQMQLEQLRKLKEALAKLDGAIKEEKREHAQSGQLAQQQKKEPLAPAAFQAPKQDQQRNRQATESVAQMTKQLGPTVAKAADGLGGACNSMSSAEASLGGAKPSDAQAQQNDAVQKMQEARNQLEAERQRVLEELQKQVKAQVVANLSEMLDRQKAVREATEQLGPRLASARQAGQQTGAQQTGASRQAELRIKQLATPEQHVIEIADQTVALIEETEFSIALPPAIRSIQRRCIYVTSDLQAGRAGEPVVSAEKQIEKDLSDLIDTFKNSSIGSAGESRCKGCNGSKNKLLAELKVIRMLQIRVNEETRDADGRRAAALAELGPELREKIGTIRDNENQVQGAMDKIHHATCPDCLKD